MMDGWMDDRKICWLREIEDTDRKTQTGYSKKKSRIQKILSALRDGCGCQSAGDPASGEYPQFRLNPKQTRDESNVLLPKQVVASPIRYQTIPHLGERNSRKRSEASTQ